MSDLDIQRLIDLAENQLKQSFTEEQALHSLITAGILDHQGNPTPPYQDLVQPQA